MAPSRSGLGLALGLVVFFLFSWFSGLYAQPSAQCAMETDGITPLQIGDTIPEALWHLPLQVVNHPEGRDTITLDDFRDKKLVILDFWATWCKPCIISVALMDSLIRDNSSVALVPIATYGHTPEELQRFIEKRHWDIFSAYRDTTITRSLLSSYMDRLGIVWIKDNRLFAVPRKSALTKAIIHAVVEGTVQGHEIVNYQPRSERGKQ